MSATDWWKGAVVYQVYPRSFQDTDGDGVGDLPGVLRRLDHIAELGADAVWLSPFYRSPQDDFGYDVSDFTDVDPLFGTLADFDAVVERAHALGLKVMVDLVLSHTSTAHPWFEESRRSRTGDKADWFVWADPRPDGSPPNNWLSVFGGVAWTWEPRRGQYYLHNFLASQPDLNLHHPDVQQAVLDVLDFWLARGVDGVRLDAVNYLFCDRQLRSNPAAGDDTDHLVDRSNPYRMQRHRYDKNQPETAVFFERMREVLDRHGAVGMGEVGDAAGSSMDLLAAYTAPGRLHLGYTFDLLQADLSEVRPALERYRATVPDGWGAWALSNHDVMRPATRLATDELPPERAARLGLAFLLLLRGTVCIYQGEELGLPEAHVPREALVDPYGIHFWPEFLGRDGCRTPVPWAADAPGAGFTAGKPWLPIPEAHRALAVDRQVDDPASVLSLCRRLVAARRASRALIRGTQAFLDAPAPLVAVRREHEGEVVVGVVNPGAEPVRWRPDGIGGLVRVSTLHDLGGDVVHGGFELEAGGAVWAAGRAQS